MYADSCFLQILCPVCFQEFQILNGFQSVPVPFTNRQIFQLTTEVFLLKGVMADSALARN